MTIDSFFSFGSEPSRMPMTFQAGALRREISVESDQENFSNSFGPAKLSTLIVPSGLRGAIFPSGDSTMVDPSTFLMIFRSPHRVSTVPSVIVVLLPQVND